MRTIIHKTIICTSWFSKDFNNVEFIANELKLNFARTKENSMINGYNQLVIFSSGSKCNWEHQKRHDEKCEKFLNEISKLENNLSIEIIVLEHGEHKPMITFTNSEFIN